MNIVHPVFSSTPKLHLHLQVAALHLPHTLKTELKDEVHSCWSSKRRPRITVTSHLVRARNQEARGL